MKKEKIILRLYRQHDMDLLLLYKNKNFGFAKAVKHALHAYIAKEPFLFYPPETVDIHNFKFKSVYKTTIFLTEGKDDDIIEFKKKVKDLHLNIAVKSILRGSMVGPYVYGCFKSDDDRIACENIYEKIREKDELSVPPVRNKAKQHSINRKNNLQKLLGDNVEEKEIKEFTKRKVENNQKSLEKIPEEKDVIENIKEDSNTYNKENNMTSNKIIENENIEDTKEDDAYDFFGELFNMQNR